MSAEQLSRMILDREEAEADQRPRAVGHYKVVNHGDGWVSSGKGTEVHSNKRLITFGDLIAQRR